MNNHRVVSREDWLVERKALLAQEKELTRQREKLADARRNLPWVRVDKDYQFDGPNGRESLSDLFGDHSQLIVQHFMLAPGWEAGCIGCSFCADHVDGALHHLPQKDVAFVAVARAPIADIEAFKKRMGWGFKWVSSLQSDFNFDFGVSFTPAQVEAGTITYNYATQDWAMEELHGHSVFYKDEAGDIFHTYSVYARGAEDLIGTYSFLDLVPKGRDEPGEHGNLGHWVKLHDEYSS